MRLERRLREGMQGIKGIKGIERRMRRMRLKQHLRASPPTPLLRLYSGSR